MTNPRTYREDEVREIFALATDPRRAAPPSVRDASGLTLAELQEIGREVGLEPAEVARAAAALDVRTPESPLRRSLGMPIEVGRVVPLPRAPTRTEWEQIVAELRTTFRARGKVSSEGGLREWANGNLHACIEPTGTGYRLRLGTLKTGARELNALGAAGVAAGTIAFGALAVSGGLPEAIFLPWMISATGVAAFLANLVRLPRWARERDRQMEHIAARVGSIVAGEPPADDG